MKKLNKATLASRNEISGRLRDRFTDLDAAVDEFNTAMDEHWAKVESAMSDYNEAVSDANAWKTDVASEIQSYMDDRSEKWQESDTAQRYSAWKEPFEEEIDTVELEQPDKLELDVQDEAEVLEQLPEEIE